jgi:tricarballylate dehydrogenase
VSALPRSSYPRTWDIVVVGAGNAALTAALAAHERGARVVVLEKAPHSLRGGNTRFSGALFRFSYEGIQDIQRLAPHLTDQVRSSLDVGVYTQEHYYQDIMRVTQHEADPVLSHVLVEQSYPAAVWMTGHGILWELTSLFNVMVDKRRVFHPGSVLQVKGKGVGLSETLFGAVEKLEIPVLYDTKFLRPLLDGAGAIHAATLRGPAGHQEIPCGAIILASGGFEANAELRARYLGGGWDRAKVRGTKYNTGEALMAALDLGAKPAGHWRGCHGTSIDAGSPSVGDLKMTDLTNRLSYPYGITVNLLGKRFVDEGEDFAQYTYAKSGGAVLDQPRSLAFQLFDQSTVGLLEKRYGTTTPIVGDTIEGLAAKLDIEPSSLSRTVQEYNEAIQDSEFNPGIRDGKGTCGLYPPKSNWAQRLDSPPYVAYPVTGGITFTFGGLEIDTQGQVLDTEDTPIPGLYATGEITGKFFYHNYPGGSGLMRGTVFGMIAGTTAADYTQAVRA